MNGKIRNTILRNIARKKRKNRRKSKQKGIMRRDETEKSR